jgi:hypothetical protein
MSKPKKIAVEVFIERAETEEIVANTHHPHEHLQEQLNQGAHRKDQRAPARSSTAHSSPAKQPPAEFTILTIAQVLAKLRLHREDTHGQHEPAAGGGDEKVHPSDKPRPEDQQVLDAEDQQVLAPAAQYNNLQNYTARHYTGGCGQVSAK